MPYSIRTAIPPGTTSGPDLADIVEEVGDLTQIVVLSDTTSQPDSPTEGDAYIVNGDVAWGGAQYDVAVFRDTTWIYHTPGEGWVAYIIDRGEARRFNGTDWNTRIPDSSPEHATDGGTDAYASATNTDAPNAGDKIERDFQSANTTTTPTLDSLTITTKDGSALWEGALSGVHTLQLTSGGGSWLVLDPNPIDEDDMSSDSDAAVPTQQSVKAWGLAAPGSSTDPSLAFDTWRTPNADRTTKVQIQLRVVTDGSTTGRIDIDIDESGGTTPNYTWTVTSDNDGGAGFEIRDVVPLQIPPGGSYQIRNTDDPNSVNNIEVHREFTL